MYLSVIAFLQELLTLDTSGAVDRSRKYLDLLTSKRSPEGHPRTLI